MSELSSADKIVDMVPIPCSSRAVCSAEAVASYAKLWERGRERYSCRVELSKCVQNFKSSTRWNRDADAFSLARKMSRERVPFR
jgi:hypothetical protein